MEVDGKARRARNLIPGGKSLSGDGHSPELKARVPKALKAEFVAEARQQRTTPAKLLRKIVTDYLAERRAQR